MQILDHEHDWPRRRRREQEISHAGEARRLRFGHPIRIDRPEQRGTWREFGQRRDSGPAVRSRAVGRRLDQVVAVPDEDERSPRHRIRLPAPRPVPICRSPPRRRSAPSSPPPASAPVRCSRRSSCSRARPTRSGAECERPPLARFRICHRTPSARIAQRRIGVQSTRAGRRTWPCVFWVGVVSSWVRLGRGPLPTRRGERSRERQPVHLGQSHAMIPAHHKPDLPQRTPPDPSRAAQRRRRRQDYACQADGASSVFTGLSGRLDRGAHPGVGCGGSGTDRNAGGVADPSRAPSIGRS